MKREWEEGLTAVKRRRRPSSIICRALCQARDLCFDSTPPLFKLRRHSVLLAVLVLLSLTYCHLLVVFMPTSTSLEDAAAALLYPQQLRLAFGEREDERVLTFASPVQGAPVVLYGKTSRRYTNQSVAESVLFEEANPLGMQWLHTAALQGLEAGQTYYYVAKLDDAHTSPEFSFVIPREGSSHPLRFLVVGDLGYEGGRPTFERMMDKLRGPDGEPAEAVIHVGDLAYHLEGLGGMEGDQFLRMVEPLSARVPYMTCVGNHERGIGKRYIHYIARFRMPGPARQNGNMWYSFNVGMVHFVAISTDYIDDRDKEGFAVEREWLLRDLEKAQANRAKRPWIIVFGHHPLYCSNPGEYCTIDAPLVQEELEEIFMTYGVDMYISGHIHAYERLWPVYKGRVMAYHYNDPAAPFQVTTGTGGCNMMGGLCFDPMFWGRGEWSAYRWWFPGMPAFGQLTIHNATHLTWEQTLARNGRVLDRVRLVQHRHGPFLT